MSVCECSVCVRAALSACHTVGRSNGGARAGMQYDCAGRNSQEGGERVSDDVVGVEVGHIACVVQLDHRRESGRWRTRWRRGGWWGGRVATVDIDRYQRASRQSSHLELPPACH